VDAIYDRAALVALPRDMRPAYAAHLAAISRNAPQLLIAFDYDQAQLAGPPFCVDADEIHALYDRHYRVALVERVAVEGGLKGKVEALESVWLLSRKS